MLVYYFIIEFNFETFNHIEKKKDIYKRHIFIGCNLDKFKFWNNYFIVLAKQFVDRFFIFVIEVYASEITALVGVELETLIFEPDALTTQPS